MLNQGGYEWKFEESSDRSKVTFEMKVPKFMDTSLLNVDVQPTYVRCEIKGKVTQLHWPEEILVEKATIQRSTTTGFLVITAPVSNYEVVLEKKAFYNQIKKEKADDQKLKDL